VKLRHRLGLGIALAALGSLSCLLDVNEDGRTVVACLGDSNTSYPWFGDFCEALAAAHRDVTFLNYAMPGAKAIGGDHDGMAQLARAAAGDPAQDEPPADVVLLAFGTNDVGEDAALGAAELSARIDALKAAARAAGMLPFVASIPPRFEERENGATACAPEPLTTPVIDAANALIEQRAGSLRFVDFHTGFTCLEHFQTDGVHLDREGQDLRAARTAEQLFGAPLP
jgi:lysophospholipase L1-like esterase